MDVVFTDANRVDVDMLHDFSIDFDTTDQKDFEIKVGIENNIFEETGYWYVEGTEYGGVVDDFTVVTSENKLLYNGRNFRGILKSKYIIPPLNQDYKVVSGNITDIANSILQEFGFGDLFQVEKCSIDVQAFQFNRYISVYDGFVDLAYSCSKVISLRCRAGKNGNENKLDKVVISFEDRIDYSGDVLYQNDDTQFRITKGFNAVNHLICLGSGELKDRMVAHLYVDADGDIVEKQYYFGLDEVVDVYELSNAQTMDELKKGGADRLGELRNIDAFEVTEIGRKDLKIGDIVGGYEEITNTFVRREIVNTIVTITDEEISIDYTVGGDAPKSASGPSDIVDEYILPIASQSVLGGIKTSKTVETDDDGTLQSSELSAFREDLKNALNVCR